MTVARHGCVLLLWTERFSDGLAGADRVGVVIAPSPYGIESVRIGLFGFRLVIIRVAFDAIFYVPVLSFTLREDSSFP
jgi:hypothetical protein